jgi:hypothetical protein
MKTHDLRVFFEQISLALCGYKRALCGKTVSIFSSPTLSEAPAQIWIFFFEMTFSHSLSFFPLWNFTEAPRRQSPWQRQTPSAFVVSL